MKVNLFIIILVIGMILISGCEVYQTVYPVEAPKENKTIEKPIEKNVSEELKPYVDPRIAELLKNNSEIRVSIVLRTSNESEIGQFLNSYSFDEIREPRKGTGWILGYITKKGLDKIKYDPLVSSVVVSTIKTTQDND